jgi:hypothetical protein
MEQKLTEISSNKAELLEAIKFLIERTSDTASISDSMSREEFKRLNSSFRSHWPP